MKLLLTILVIVILSFVNAVNVFAQRTDSNRPNTKTMLRSYLNLNSFRHKVFAQNIANVNTPGYKADEVPMPKNMLGLKGINHMHNKKIRLARTSEKHISGINDQNNYYNTQKLQDPDEIKPNGNNVSLQQQVTKMSQNKTDYDTALHAYQGINSLYSIILGK